MSDNFYPLVSIIIPVYNGSNYLKEAIDSALNQTYKNIEILVINDGSTDNGETEKIALSYKEKIRYFNKSNGGVASALNLGIEKMQGEYFSWLSHDDVYYPSKIEEQIDFLKTKTNKNIVLYGDIVYVDEKFNVINYLKLPHFEPKLFRPAFIRSGLINGCTLLVPKICFKICGLFNLKFKTIQDYDMWFRISEKFEFHHIAHFTIYSRVHKNQDTLKLRDIVVKENNYLYISFLKKIKRTELNYFSKNNISEYYVNFSRIMSNAKLGKAKKYAIILSILNLPLSRSINFKNNLNLIMALIGGKTAKVYFKVKSIL